MFHSIDAGNDKLNLYCNTFYISHTIFSSDSIFVYYLSWCNAICPARDSGFFVFTDQIQSENVM